jgi:hypothetical protein
MQNVLIELKFNIKNEKYWNRKLYWMFLDQLFEGRFSDQNRRRSSAIGYSSDQKDQQRTYSGYFLFLFYL